MLQVLEDLNYIARDGAGGYLLTNRLFALGMRQPTVPFVGGGSERLSADAALDVLRQTADRISHDIEGSRLA